MENEIDILREIKGLRDDKKSGSIVLSAEKEKFAKSLKNGLGEAMINHLNNPPKPSFWAKIKQRFRKKF